MPTEPLLDAVLIFVAGALLLTPGVLTDLLGITLLIPWTASTTAAGSSHGSVRTSRSRLPVSAPGPPPRGRSEVIDSYVIGHEEKDHQE